MGAFVIIGSGIAGLSGAMMLARDGHRVTVLQRDPTPPPPPEHAWTCWERRGVAQFRQPHGFLPRFRALLAVELPDVVDALVEAGALRANRLLTMPAEVTGGWRDGDEQYEMVTGRRPLVESIISALAERVPGVEIRRGVLVRGLVADGESSGVPRVAGIVTTDGERVNADLVVDASGRRSPLPEWLAAIGARRPVDEFAARGTVYYSRHFRSDDGSMPAFKGPVVQHYDSVSLATLPADNGHWSVVLFTTADHAALKPARRTHVWDRIVHSFPLVAHWLDAAPVTGVDVMPNVFDRVRHFVADGEPEASGVIAVGDAAACTTPSLGRGASIALLQTVCLRDALREVPADRSEEFARHWHERTAAVVSPFVGDTLRFDAHRLAEMQAQIDGVRYETDDPSWVMGKALAAAAPSDPDLLRAFTGITGLLERGADVFARPGMVERLRSAAVAPPAPAPSRAELLEIIDGASEEAVACASR